MSVPMNDAQKAQEIGRLAGDTSDDALTTQQLAQIADWIWPNSKANHIPFMQAYIQTVCDEGA